MNVSTSTTTLRMIPEGEKFSPSDTPTDNPDVWISRYSVKAHRDGPRYEMQTTWDFSKCERVDLIGLTFYDLRVWAQANLRNMGDSMVSKGSTAYAKVDVKNDRIHAARQPVDPEIRFIRAAAAAGISEAEARALLAAKKATEPVAEVSQEENGEYNVE